MQNAELFLTCEALQLLGHWKVERLRPLETEHVAGELFSGYRTAQLPKNSISLLKCYIHALSIRMQWCCFIPSWCVESL